MLTSYTKSNMFADPDTHSIVNHEQVQERSSSTAARTKSRSGQKRGVAYFSKTELSALLVLIEEHKPCGAFQWDIVSTAMYNAGHKNRYRDAYKKKFDRLCMANQQTNWFYGNAIRYHESKRDQGYDFIS